MFFYNSDAVLMGLVATVDRHLLMSQLLPQLPDICPQDIASVGTTKGYIDDIIDGRISP